MTDARGIAEMLSAAARGPDGPEDAGFHTAVVLDWNDLTGANEIDLYGVTLTDVRTLTSGIGINFNAGDVVVLIRKQSQFFILGKVGSVGGSVGSALQDSQGSFDLTFGTGGAWGNPPSGPGPGVTVNIGSSRAALVFFRAEIGVKVGDTGFGSDVYDPDCVGDLSFEVSGATTIAPGFWSGQKVSNEAEFWNAAGGQMHRSMMTVSGFMPVTAAHGLNAGLNTFTMKYRTSQTVQFRQPGITVVPL
jgi:hypothetical protein